MSREYLKKKITDFIYYFEKCEKTEADKSRTQKTLWLMPKLRLLNVLISPLMAYAL